MQFRSPKSGEAPAGPASSTLRAFAVLEQIARSEAPPTLEGLTRACALPKPTVHRILALLMRGGLVQRDAFEKRYTVGPRTSGLALLSMKRWHSARPRRASSRPPLRSVAP